MFLTINFLHTKRYVNEIFKLAGRVEGAQKQFKSISNYMNSHSHGKGQIKSLLLYINTDRNAPDIATVRNIIIIVYLDLQPSTPNGCWT